MSTLPTNIGKRIVDVCNLGGVNIRNVIAAAVDSPGRKIPNDFVVSIRVSRTYFLYANAGYERDEDKQQTDPRQTDFL